MAQSIRIYTVIIKIIIIISKILLTSSFSTFASFSFSSSFSFVPALAASSIALLMLGARVFNFLSGAGAGT